MLLLRRDGCGGTSRGWLLLALPCPVCFSVILCSVALVHGLFADHGTLLIWLCTGYLLLALGSAALLLRRQGLNERGLGGVMLLAALYFIVTVVLVPQFNDLERVYRLGQGMITVPEQYLLLPAWMIPVFIIGFLQSGRK
jgi:predicted transporter